MQKECLLLVIISISKNQQHHFVAQIDDLWNQGKGIHELKIVEAVQACGVSLTIWQDKTGIKFWLDFPNGKWKEETTQKPETWNVFPNYPATKCLQQGHKIVEG